MTKSEILEGLQEIEAIIGRAEELTSYAIEHAQICIRMAQRFIKDNKEQF